jgi:nicotinic acetylcholine receptor
MIFPRTTRTISLDFLDFLGFSLTDGARFGGSCLIHGPSLPRLPLHADCEDLQVAGEVAAAAVLDGSKSPVLRPSSTFSHSKCPPEIHRSCICVRFIAEHTKMLEDSTKVRLSFVLD